MTIENAKASISNLAADCDEAQLRGLIRDLTGEYARRFRCLHSRDGPKRSSTLFQAGWHASPLGRRGNWNV